MKMRSFLPAAREMIYRMGLDREFCGLTVDCPLDKPKVVRSGLEGNHYSSLKAEKGRI